jgi:2-keto-3-deoxygluconate permease
MRSTEHFPGSLMGVPLLIGATIVTFAPGTSKFPSTVTRRELH